METYPTEMTVTAPCANCGSHVSVPLPIQLELIHADFIAKWPASRLEDTMCGSCGAVWPLGEMPCVYWGDGWAALTLDGPRTGIEILTQIANWMPVHRFGSAGSPFIVRVFDSLKDLGYVLKHPECSVFREDLKGRVTRHWDDEVLALIDISDAALEGRVEWLSYVILAGVVQDYPEFFFISQMRNALELTALASGDESLPISADGASTGLDEYNQMVKALEPHRPVSELDSYHIWYDAPLDENTERPIEGSVTRLIRQSPPNIDLCKVWLRILVAGAFLRHELTKRKLPATQRAKEWLCEEKLRARWPHLAVAERTKLGAYFQELTGRELKDVYGLDSRV